jgi:nucleotide-binding universal stress UspA family protein
LKPKTIVSVLDSLSAPKDVALTKAVSLARWYESALHVIYVAPSARVGESGGDAGRDDLAMRIMRLADGSGIAGLEVSPAVLSGNPVRAIAEYTARVSADLVVVGKKAQRASGYWSAGSFAAAVGKAVKPPTIAISRVDRSPTDSGSPFRNIVVGVDFSEASFRALDRALVLAQESGGRLRLLHVLEGFPYGSVYSGGRAFRLMQDFRANVAHVDRQLESLIPPDALNWAQIDVATVSGLAHEAIAAAASERRADLVVLGLSRRSRIDEFVSGSTVHRILRRMTSPVLLVPDLAKAAAVETDGEEEDDVRVATPAGALSLRTAVYTNQTREGGASWP